MDAMQGRDRRGLGWAIWARTALPAVLCTVLVVIFLYAALLPAVERSLLDNRRDGLVRQVGLLHDVFRSHHESVLEGELAEVEAKEHCLEIARNIRIGSTGKDYFWVNDLDHVMLAHPYRPDLEGQNLHDLQDPTGRYFIREFVRVAEQQGSGFVDYVWQWQDDQTRPMYKFSYVRVFEPWGWVIGTGMYLRDVEREIASLTRFVHYLSVGLVLIVLIITGYLAMVGIRGERRRLHFEEQVQRSESRYRGIFELAPLGILLLDRQSRVLSANPFMEEWLGYSADEMAGVPLVDQPSLTPSARERASQLWDETDPGEVLGPFELTLVDSDGREHIAEVRALSVAEDFQEGIAAIVVAADVTAHRHSQRERALLEERLAHSRRLEAIGQLAGGVAHDFNNLLAPIMGYTDLMLMQTPAGSPDRSRLREIQSAAARAKVLVQELLTFGRRQVLDRQVVDLGELVNGFLGILRGGLREDIRIDLDLADQTVAALVDHGQVEHALMNLVVNARDAMPEGGVLILRTYRRIVDGSEVAEFSAADPGEYSVLEVEDTGDGMPDEVQERAFEPFYSTKEVGQGSGLGLATVHGMVEQHGGFVTLASIEGEGTRVSLHFPFVMPAVDDAPPDDQTEAEANGTGIVLVVEDEPIVRELAATILAEQGYRVFEAGSGAEAIKLVDDGLSPDLLLTDVIMPEMDGPQLYHTLRDRDESLRVLYMSGYPKDILRQRSTLDERPDVLPKPFSVTELTSRVRQALD
jgi:PAS domain S-box-containing protein